MVTIWLHWDTDLCATIDGVNMPSRSGNDFLSWRKLWSLTLPRKIIIFIWRVLNGCLPTREALIRRRINIDIGCPLCDAQPEPDFHILCGCLFARVVWLVSKWAFRNIAQDFSSLGAWIMALLQHVDKADVEEILSIMWARWKSRNAAIFKHEKKAPREVVELGTDMCFQYQQAMGGGRPNLLTTAPDAKRWRLTVGIKLKCDASIYKLDGARWAGAGFILRNSNGDFLLAGGVKFDYLSNVAMAELKSLLWALLICSKEYVLVTQIEIDCKQVVNWIKSKQFNGEMGHVIEDCCMVMNPINCSSIEHCKRGGKWDGS
ncbi:PREDICTED: uncharacterized protein LOC18590259 [Theobroma cacao]|uniref:Uncharacterized protein LOC18590259 n=1 Tax=Theobroma cacao TaxID=3641 RepID=A0AB32WKE4_THECC|nr:PREDICTED: uncharacterized protein LOC18590259 [Theobroma cacao]